MEGALYFGSQKRKISKPMRPLSKNIIVEPTREESITKSGLHLTKKDSDALRYKRGIIKMVGVDVIGISAGDIVHYDSRAGYSLMVHGELVTMITERDVALVE